MNLNGVASAWQALAEFNPTWAILSSSHDLTAKHDREAFFASGREEIAEAFRRLAAVPLAIDATMAVDFGCGMGRATQALAAKFEKTVGIDIAPTMIALANEANSMATCTYVLNEKDDLSFIPSRSVSFIWSHLVLQHMPQRFIRGYVREFVRILVPGGIAMIQIPVARPSSMKRSLETALLPVLYPLVPAAVVRLARRLRFRNATDDRSTTIPSFPAGALRIYGLDRTDVHEIVTANGGSVIATDANTDVGRGWLSYRYIIVAQ